MEQWWHAIRRLFQTSGRDRKCSIAVGGQGRRHEHSGSRWEVFNFNHRFLLLLGGELLAERCRTDDLMPSIPISCLPPRCMDPEVQGLYTLIYCSQPGDSWADQRASSSLLVVLEQWRWHGGVGGGVLRGRASQVSKEPQAEGLHPIGNWQAPGNTPDCLGGSVPGVRNSQNFPQTPGVKGIETSF